jgi:pyruvate-formate lyase-activating enzyme
MSLQKENIYRFPWSLNDNPIGWLEITDRCNIYCLGCYRINGMEGHKPLEQVKEEIDLLKKWRNCDNISIAGGEPLIHPDILEIVAYIRQKKMKPLILTNGVRLENEPGFLQQLKDAGMTGMTFHIDSFQHRPQCTGQSEHELFELRLKLARMTAEVGGLHVGFGMTVYPGNLDFVPEMVRWANDHIELVHGLVFITYRAGTLDDRFDYYVDGEKIEPKVPYVAPTDEDVHITSVDVYSKIKEHFPHYEAAAYLGGTATHDKITWLSAAQIGAKGRMFGSVGTKVMELAQTFHHVLRGTYLVYMQVHRLTKLAWILSLLDSGIRRAHGSFWRALMQNPKLLFEPLYLQTIGIIQAPDQLANGQVDMCESCPDMTVWDGKLVHSCRMEEWRLYGNYVTAHPRMGQHSAGGVIPPGDIPVMGERSGSAD